MSFLLLFCLFSAGVRDVLVLSNQPGPGFTVGNRYLMLVLVQGCPAYHITVPSSATKGGDRGESVYCEMQVTCGCQVAYVTFWGVVNNRHFRDPLV